MKLASLDEFREILRAEGRYSTPPDGRAPKPLKPGILTTLRYNAAVFNVFPRCAVAEARGKLTTDRWAHVCWSAVKTAERFGGTFTCEGWRNAEEAVAKSPVVYVANHMSTLETVILPPILLTYGPFNGVVKASLMHMPFLGSAAIHMGLIPLTRTNPRKDLVTLLERGSECISKGSSMLIFPQGTRQETFSAAKYSSIGAKLAERCGVPLVPIALQTDLEKKGTGLFKDFGKVDLSRPLRFSCGPAIPADKANGGAKAAHAKSFEWIAGKLREWSLPVEDAPRSSAQI